MRKLSAAVLFFYVLSLILITPDQGVALTSTWDGGGVGFGWTEGDNWGGSAPDVGYDLVFTTSNTDNDNDYDAGTVFNSITFNDVGGSCDQFILNGNAIGLTSHITSDYASDQISNLDIGLEDDVVINSNVDDYEFHSNGTITNNNHLLTVTGDGDVELFGALTGTGGLTKTGTGVLTISGTTSDYSGATNINGGEVWIQDANAFGNSTAINFAGGTLVSLGGTYSLGSTRAIALSADSAIKTDNGTFTINGTVNNGGNTLTVTGAADTTITGLVSGTGGLTKSMDGVLTLSRANTYSGATTINAGTVKVGADQALGTGSASVTATGGALDLNGVTYSTNSALSIIGTGVGATGALTNSSTTAATYGGVVTVGAGGATIGGTGNITLSQGFGNTANALTKAGTGTLILNAASSRTGATTINSGSTIRANNANALGTGNLTNSGTFTLGTTQLNIGTGDYAQNTGSTLNVTANSSNDYGKVITSGTATGDGGAATINVTVGGYLANSSALTVIDSGSIDAGFADPTINVSGTNLVSFSGAATGGKYVLTAIRNNSYFTNIVPTGNSGNAATAFGGATNPDADMASVQNNLSLLSNEKITETVKTFVPDVSGMTTVATSNIVNQFVGATISQIVPTPIQTGTTTTIQAATTTSTTQNPAAGSTNASSSSTGAQGSSGTVGPDNKVGISDNGVVVVLDNELKEPVKFRDNPPDNVLITMPSQKPLDVQLNGNTLNIKVDAEAPPQPRQPVLGTSTLSMPGASQAKGLKILQGETESDLTLPGGVIGGLELSKDNTLRGVVAESGTGGFKKTLDSAGSVSAESGEVQVQVRLKKSGVSEGDQCLFDLPRYLRGMNVWAKGMGDYAHQGARGTSNGYNASTWSITGGFDLPCRWDSVRIGLGSGYGQSFVRSKDNSGRSDIGSIPAILYGSYSDQNHPFYISTMAMFNYSMNNSSRQVSDGTNMRTAYGDYNGQQYSGYIEGGYSFFYKNLTLTPSVSVQYMHLHTGSYTETGADSLNLKMDSQDYDMAQTGLGAKLAYPFANKYVTLTPDLHFKWMYDWIGDSQSSTASFTGGGTSFASQGSKPAQSAYDIGTNITLDTKYNISLDLSYDLTLKEDYYEHTGVLNVKYKF